MSKTGALRSFKHRNFRVLYPASVVSNIGTWAQRVAQDWLVLELTNSAAALGIVTGLQFLPTIFLSIWSGALADRFGARGRGLCALLTVASAAIYLGGPKGGGGTKAVYKNEWTLNLNRDYVDATTFGDTNKTYLVGLKDLSGTFAGILDTDGDALLDAASQDEVLTYLYADDRDTHEVLVGSGQALFDAAVNCSNTDAVRISGNFRAANSWVILETP